ncbi:MAG: sigma-70 family RNA polymerase sigma factor [Anaerolineales bacterium]|nr:sigma-70 family RNA polymerase sigma factor [Anaerolineales bacterium]
MTRPRILPWPRTKAAEEDFEASYRAELPRIYNFFRYRVGDGPLAEDLTSETFEKAWRRRGSYARDLAAFSTWLFTIARRVAIDHYRTHKVEAPVEPLACTAGEETPEDLAERRDDFSRLSVLLARLADRERELVALKYGAGLTNRAIADLTGLGESNVGVILFRTLNALRSRWEENP